MNCSAKVSWDHFLENHFKKVSQNERIDVLKVKGEILLQIPENQFLVRHNKGAFGSSSIIWSWHQVWP